MRQIVSASLGLWIALGGAAAAQDAAPPVVVELYTSQGCSSCPPADAILAELAGDPRVIALALHVDYWDYLGWEDKFADAAFTARQKSYARAAGDRMIYTPQMIVNGADRIVGSKPAEIAAAVKAHAALPMTVRLTVRREGDRLVIRAEAVPPQDRALRIDLVRYMPEEMIEIERGENAGSTITYHNIVTDWDTVADWRGDAPIEVKVAAGGRSPAVVLVQADGPSEIIAAAAVR